MNAPPTTEPVGKRTTLQKIWIALPFVFLLWAGLHTPFLVLDFWWHLKMGEIIVTTRSIPTTDVFSYTAFGQPFVAQNWLAEAILYLLYRMLGLEGLVIIGTALILSTLLFIHRIVCSAGLGIRVVAVADLLVVIGLMLCSNLRTQLISILFFAVTYWALEDFRAGHRRKLILLPVMMLLWVNMHGAFVLGLLLFGVYLAAECASSWSRGTLKVDAPLLRTASLLFLLTVVATLVNPSGPKVYEYVAQVTDDPASRHYVREWQPPRIDEPEMLLAIFVPGALVLLSMMVSRRRAPAIEIVLVFTFIGFALLSRRNSIWFSLIAGPIFARQLACIDWERLTNRFHDTTQTSVSARRALNTVIVFLLAMISIVASPWVYPRLGNERIGTSLLDKRTPVGAVNFMESRQLFGRVFHPQIYGDYLIWRLWPGQKSFIDGRVHLFPLEISDRYIRTMNAVDWEESFASWRIEYVLLSKDEPDTAVLMGEVRASPEWKPIYEDLNSVLFAPRTAITP